MLVRGKTYCALIPRSGSFDMMRDAGIFPHPNMDALLVATVKSTKQDSGIMLPARDHCALILEIAVVKVHTRNAVARL